MVEKIESVDLPLRVPHLNEVQVIDARGPWNTKSGGKLMVLLAMPQYELFEKYFSYDEKELNRVPVDIRGLRFYSVRDLPQDRIGGTEFHRIRQEIVFGLEGKTSWKLEDLSGQIKELILDPQKGIYLPPFILHTYISLTPGSGLLIIANTLFNPEDSRTHDTYPDTLFREMQRKFT